MRAHCLSRDTQGLFEYNVVPYGIVNAPSVLQSSLEHVLEECRERLDRVYGRCDGLLI